MAIAPVRKKFLDVAGAGRRNDVAGAQEQQTLERRVIQNVRETRRHCHGRQIAAAVSHGHHSRPQAEHDDAGVFNRAVRQQPLDVGLCERVEHTEHCRDAPEEQTGERPIHMRRSQPERTHADEPIDSGRNEDGGHQRGNAARRCRMRLG
jgi:hypothetical protein